MQEGETEATSPSEAWSPGDNSNINKHNTNSWNNEKTTINNRKLHNAWEDTEFEPLDETPGANNRLEEARKRQEERKLLRQKQLEARKATRNIGGPMKLGVKKM